MFKEAKYYKKLKDEFVQCCLCPKNCVIKNGEYGNCNARKNISGKLYSMVYGKLVAVHIDPIEKKPLYHFMPGSKVFSIGTNGCNLHCKFCQNWEISQVKADENGNAVNPKKVVEECVKSGCEIIAYTYNEPTVFYEYMLETAKLARERGLKNVMVSNGFINEKPLRELVKFIDAVNVDLKGFDDNFYKKYCGALLEPVLNSLKIIYNSGIHLEITNLIIHGLNDDFKMIDKMCKWIVSNLSEEVVLHFSAFYPQYKMMDIERTSKGVLIKAKDIALKNGLKNVYVGNI